MTGRYYHDRSKLLICLPTLEGGINSLRWKELLNHRNSIHFLLGRRAGNSPFRLHYQIPQTGWLIHNRNLFLTVLEAGKSNIKTPGWSCSGEGPLPGSWSMSSQCVLLWEMSSGALWGLFTKMQILFIKVLSSWPKLRPHFLIWSSLGGLGFQYMNLQGTRYSDQSSQVAWWKSQLFIIRGTDVSSSPFPVCSAFSPGFLCAYTLIQGYTHLQNFLLDHSTHIFLQLSFLFNGRLYHKHLSDDSPYQYISFSLKPLTGPQWLHTSIYLISSLSKDM